ncbi:MAG: hypothetical protein PHO37_12385 [Kiritimatiellae bacterium]|nr:hypothetical protein [Kiritimatiellia bacterium]
MNRLSYFFLKIVFALFVAVIVLVSYLYIHPQVVRNRLLLAGRDAIEAEIQQKKSEIKKFADMQQDFTSSYEFVEYIGHQNKQVWGNEVVFVFDDD